MQMHGKVDQAETHSRSLLGLLPSSAYNVRPCIDIFRHFVLITERVALLAGHSRLCSGVGIVLHWHIADIFIYRTPSVDMR